MAPPPSKPAVPSVSAPSNLTGNKSNEVKGQLNDLIQLYQEAAFSDPVLTAARFNYQASKELYWQGFLLLMPQANATPGGTRYYQHGTGSTLVSNNPGNSRVFDALTSQDHVALCQNKKDLIKQQLEAAQAKFDTDLATIVDVNTAQAALDLANSQEIAAQADLIVKRGALEQIVGRPVGALKPLIKNAQIGGVLKDPRSKSKDSKGNPIAENVNPQLPPGQTLEDWINQAESSNFNVLAG
uniref:Type I secretion outer membrane protein, TolC family n=1 Tax=Polynucleobacter necessarius subsp. necessarius (strain STIR1) TaxID=452638 RepID=B1XTA0_POLNS